MFQPKKVGNKKIEQRKKLEQRNERLFPGLSVLSNNVNDPDRTTPSNKIINGQNN